jgi:hypothetical protein
MLVPSQQDSRRPSPESGAAARPGGIISSLMKSLIMACALRAGLRLVRIAMVWNVGRRNTLIACRSLLDLKTGRSALMIC